MRSNVATFLESCPFVCSSYPNIGDSKGTQCERRVCLCALCSTDLDLSRLIDLDKMNSRKIQFILVQILALCAILSLAVAASIQKHEDDPSRAAVAVFATAPSKSKPQGEKYESNGESPKKSPLSGSTKFALVTTGRQVKLYPLLEGDRRAEGHILMKIYHQSRSEERQSGWNPNYRGGDEADSILPQGLIGPKRSKSSSRSSIIPARNIKADSGEFIGKEAQPDFWISDVNYFFDSRYCEQVKGRPAKFSDCLVIIYLDTKNNQIGIAPFDLREVQKSHHQQTVWSQRNQIINLGADNSQVTLASELAFDRLNRLLYTFIPGDQNDSARILKLDLQEPFVVDEPSISRYICQCLGELRLNNLNIYENNPDGLFFSDIRRTDPNQMQSISGMFDVGSNPILLLNFQAAAIVSEIKLNHVDSFGVSGSAPDPVTHRLYWLTERNELKSSSFLGTEVTVENRLATRPLIKAPGRTEIVAGTFYFSDSKKRLLYHKLPSDLDEVHEGHQLLLMEEHLENFRIGSTNPPWTCSDNDTQQEAKENPREPKLCYASIQSLANDLITISILAEDHYSDLKARVGYCWQLQVFLIFAFSATIVLTIILLDQNSKMYSKKVDEKSFSEVKNLV